jgi:metallo-beta-lactamase family protein
MSKKSFRFTRLGRFTGKNIRGDSIEVSCGVLDVIENGVNVLRIVVDCGAHAVRDESVVEQLIIPDLSIFADGKKIDDVLITHAHMDHMGAIPFLVPFLSAKAHIVMTLSTALEIEQMYLQDLRMANVPGASEKMYDVDCLNGLLDRFVALRHEGVHTFKTPIGPIPMWVEPAGHVTGACSYSLRIFGKVIFYSGDRCDHHHPTLRGARPVPAEWQADIVAGTDCTYMADETGFRGDYDAEMGAAANLCKDAIMEGRRVVFFTFALGRAGLIAHSLQRAGVADMGDIVLDGVSAVGFANMFTRAKALWSRADRVLQLSNIWFLRGKRDRLQASYIDNGLVVIAPPGMGGPGYPGAGTFWRAAIIEDGNATMFFTGYLAPDSDGARTVEAARRRDETGEPTSITFRELDKIGGSWHDVTYQLKCKVKRVRLGGHSGRDATIQWLRQLNAPVMVLSHGSPQAFQNAEDELRASGYEGRIVRADTEPSFEIEIEAA